jgi:hypothetical protein
MQQGIYNPNNNLAQYTTAEYEAAKQLVALNKQTQAMKDSLNFNLSTISPTFSNFEGVDASSSKNSDTYFDHIETRLENLNDALDETKEKANDTLNGWSERSNAYNQSLAQILTLKAEQEKARTKYLEEANKSGLSNNYKRLVEQGAIQIDKLSNDDPLKEQIDSYQKWYEKVKECDEAIEQLDKDYLEWINDSRNFRWEAFDYLEDSISRITDEANDLIDLLSSKDLFDDKGNLNEYGNATLALHESNLEVYKQQAKDNLEEMKSLQKELANGGGEDVLNKYRERADAHREAVLAIEQEKKAMLDLVEEGMQSQLDTINEIIAKKNKVLTAVGIYYLTNSVLAFVIMIFSLFGISSVLFWASELNDKQANVFILLALLLICLFLATILSVLYLIIYRLIDKKLNLA